MAMAFYTGTRNFSAEGACFISFKKLEIGTSLRIEFVIPDLKKAVVAKGKVIWAKPLKINDEKAADIFEIGVHMFGLSEIEKMAIEQYAMAKT